MSPISKDPPIMMGIPECKNSQRQHFDAKTITSELVTTEPPFTTVTKKSLECAKGVQTMCHPPIALEPIMRGPSNRFRKQVLWKYPFLVNKDSLYDKQENRYRDPEETISTYKRDYCCELGDIELVRSNANDIILPDTSPKRSPGLLYRPRNRANFSSEMRVFYSLPGGRWALNAREKRQPPPPLKPICYENPYCKWESEYQANINGLADYMSKMRVLTRKMVRVRRIPTLPED